MNKFLSTDSFDQFLLETAQVRMSVVWTCDGHMNKAFFSNEEWEDPAVRPYSLSTWKNIRPHIYELIRGKKAPSAFTFILQLKPEIGTQLLMRGNASSLTDAVNAFVLTVRFDNQGLTLRNGVSFSTFLPDRSADQIWDHYILDFLDRREISYDILV